MNVQSLSIDDEALYRLTLAAIRAALQQEGRKEDDPQNIERELDLYYTLRDGVHDAVENVFQQVVGHVRQHISE